MCAQSIIAAARSSPSACAGARVTQGGAPFLLQLQASPRLMRNKYCFKTAPRNDLLHPGLSSTVALNDMPTRLQPQRKHFLLLLFAPLNFFKHLPNVFPAKETLTLLPVRKRKEIR